MGPRSLDVRSTFRKKRLWPWVAGALVLLAVGLWELQTRRHKTSSAPAISTVAGSESSRIPGSSPPLPGPGPAPRRPDAPTGAISGRVLTGDGRPAAGVTVVAAPEGIEARTGDDGQFRLDVQQGNLVRLEAHHSDLGFATAEVRGPAPGVELRLEPRAALEVQVLSEGNPAPGAAISVQQRLGEGALFHADRVTDAAGALRFLGLPGGPLEVEALLADTGARARVSVVAREGSVARVTLLLPTVGVVRGVVVTRAGAPVAGAFVGVEEAEGLPARSGDDGRFVLKGLRVGNDYRLTARTPELSLDVPVTARTGQGDVRLVVREQPVFRGRVVGPSGAPVRAFAIEGRPIIAEDGRFATPLEVREGRVEFRIAAEGLLTRAVQAGGTISELGDIPMQAAPRIQGRVRLQSGQPVAGAEVSAGPDTTRSDATGAFTLAVTEPPPAGAPLFVHAVQGDLAGGAEVSLAAPAEVVLAGEHPVRVRVYGPAGEPARGRTVQLAGLRTYAWTTGPDGTVSGTALAGDYRASTDARPGRVWFVRLPTPEVVLGGGVGAATLEVDLDRPVEALWVEKGAVSGPVQTERPGPRGEGQLLFGVDRSARFDGLSPGTWTVVGLRQGAWLQRTVQVSGPTRVSLER